MKTKFALTLVATALATLVSTQAQAGMLGSTVTSQYYSYGGQYNGGGSPDTFVANGTAQSSFFNYYNLTVSDSQITYDFLSSVTWSSSGASLNTGGLYITNGNLLTFSGAPSISSVTLDGASSFTAGFSNSNITFNTNSIATDWQQLTFNSGDKLIFNVNAVSAVPEPETYALMLAGFGIVAGVSRRRLAAKA